MKMLEYGFWLAKDEENGVKPSPHGHVCTEFVPALGFVPPAILPLVPTAGNSTGNNTDIEKNVTNTPRNLYGMHEMRKRRLRVLV